MKTSIVDAINAAQADIDDAKAGLGAFISCTAYSLTDGYYKKTSYNSAKTWTSKDEEPVELSGLSYAIVPVLKGDEVILTAANNNATYRTYILVDDSTNKVYASSTERETGSIIPVTADGTLVVNNRTSFIANPSIVIRRNNIGNDVTDLAERTTLVETELESIDKEGINAVLQVAEQGHATIDGDWRIGSWTSSGWAASYTYRVALATQFRTEKDLEVVCERGYQLAISSVCDDETVVSSGSFACHFKIPAHSNSKITMRRINEDTSEVLTDDDILTFANALHIVSMPWTDYERLKPTFFGIEMFRNMTIIGDSYSAGNNGENWGTCMARLTGLDVTVLAQSGINSIGWLTSYLPTLLANPATELYWLNLGINDGARVDDDASYLGSLADIDPNTYPDYDSYPQTFYGCTGRIIKNIQAHAPNAKIVIQKTLFGNMRNAQTDIQTTDTKKINDAIAIIAEYYGIPCLDQLDDPFYVSTEYGRSMSNNHPRRYAWVGMANANRRLLSKAILNNAEYFY